MTTKTEAQEAGGAETPKEPKSRIEVVEEVVYQLVDRVEQLAKAVDTLGKTALKKSTQRFGTEHKAKAVKDTKTGKIYSSLFSAGKNLATEFGLDPLNNQVWYQIAKKADEGRFVILAADDPEAIKAQAEAKAEIEREVAEANRKLQEEEKAAEAAAAPKGKAKGK